MREKHSNTQSKKKTIVRCEVKRNGLDTILIHWKLKSILLQAAVVLRREFEFYDTSLFPA